jgi:hypothetical protein
MSPIKEFWTLVSARAPALAKARSANDAQYDELLASLHRVDPGLFIHFQNGGGDFVISADGDPNLFSVARDVAAAAPRLPGWKVLALKPKLGFPMKTEWEGTTVSTDDVVFLPLSRPGFDDLGLRVYVRGLRAQDVEAATNAVYRMLDDGLGEERFALSVVHLQVLPLPDHVDGKVYPIRDLDGFIARRETERATQ